MGHSEEIERLLAELEENNGELIPISESFLFIPDNALISRQKSQTESHLRIEKNCKILGNYVVNGNVFIDDDTQLFGALNATGDVVCGKQVVIHGNVSGGGEIQIKDKAKIFGNMSGGKILLSKTASVQGTLFASKGISFIDSSEKQVTEKVKRFETDADIVDEVKSMLE